MITAKVRDNGGLYLQTRDLKDYGYFKVFDLGALGYRVRLMKEPKGLYTLYNFKKNYRAKGIRKIAHSESGLLLHKVFYPLPKDVAETGIRSSATYEISPFCKGRGYLELYFSRILL